MAEFAGEFEQLHARAYRVAFRLLGSRADAEDVAAETLARTYLRWRQVGSYAQPWVAKVAANLAIDAGRRRRRDSAAVVAERAMTDPHVEQRLDLHRALRSLSRRQREVVVLRYLADLPEQDVAAALHCSVGSVKTHASRGLAALRMTLADPDVGG